MRILQKTDRHLLTDVLLFDTFLLTVLQSSFNKSIVFVEHLLRSLLGDTEEISALLELLV